jgi:hypothetical protein
MGLGDFLKKGAQRLGKAVGHEAHRAGHAVKSTVKEAIDTVKDVVKVGKEVGEKVKGLPARNPKSQGNIDMSQFDAKDVKTGRYRIVMRISYLLIFTSTELESFKIIVK